MPKDLEKKYDVEQLKTLSAQVFEGLIDPTDVEAWLSILEKCFDVMDCLEEMKVRLTTSLL